MVPNTVEIYTTVALSQLLVNVKQKNTVGENLPQCYVKS